MHVSSLRSVQTITTPGTLHGLSTQHQNPSISLTERGLQERLVRRSDQGPNSGVNHASRQTSAMPMKGKARIQLPESTSAEAGIKSSAERGSQTLRQACCQENPGSAMCVQNLDDSRGLAIRITYRISLRSSSLWEPRHPLLKVVMSLGFGEAFFRCRQTLLQDQLRPVLLDS